MEPSNWAGVGKLFGGCGTALKALEERGCVSGCQLTAGHGSAHYRRADAPVRRQAPDGFAVYEDFVRLIGKSR